MSTSPSAALLRGAALAITASALLAPAAHAAGPVVTGIDETFYPNLAQPTITISGSGFTGATSVTTGARVISFTVVSDHTIRAQLDRNGPGTYRVRVTADGITSPSTPLGQFTTATMNPPNGGGFGPVTCTLAGSSAAAFSALLETRFGAPAWTTAPAGTSIDLRAVQVKLSIPARAAGTPDPLGEVVGDATVTSLDAAVSGAAQTSLDLAAPGPEASFPLGTSVDGNKLVFDAGSFASSRLDLLPTPGTVSLTLRGYHARVALAGGATSSLDCLPKEGGAVRLLGIFSTSPAPRIDTVTPATGSSSGGTVVRLAGSGFVPGMFVRFGGEDATKVTVLSSTQIEAVVPPRPAGPATLDVGSEQNVTSTSFTYVGSVPSTLRTKTIPLTCTLPGATTAAHPTLTMRGLVQRTALPGESVGIGNMAAALALSPADVDALRSVQFDGTSAYADFPLNIAGSSVAGTTVNYTTSPQPHRSPTGNAPIPVGTFGGLTAGSGLAFTFVLGPYDRGLDDTLPYDLGIANGGAGSAVTASVLPFVLSVAGANPQVSCAPSGDSEFIRIPVVDPTPSPSPTPTPAGVNLALKGSATLKTLAKGSVPLTGSLKGAFTRGAFTGDLALNPATANLVAYGFLPVTATLAFTQLTPTTGTLNDAGGTDLQLSSKVRVKLPSVKLFGIELVSGATCQAANPAILGLKSPAFSAAGGGTLTGTFAISNLTGCGALNGIVSPLTAGGSNAIALTATPATPPVA